MKLFTTFGSWGEIAPLLEIALQLQEKGESVAFATTEDWASRVEAYGVKCHSFPPHSPHKDNLDDFMRAHLVGRIKPMMEVIAKANPDEIIASFYSFPALAHAISEGLKITLTTTTPHYFMETEAVNVLSEVKAETIALVGDGGCEASIIGLYPWYLHNDVRFPCVGFPQLRALKPLSDEVRKFIEKPYGVVSCGTLVNHQDINKMVNAVQAHGLPCLYLGKHQTKAECSSYLDNHYEAVKKASVCITHAGIGTTVDCMGLPMVVSPVGYDQFYNARRLIELKCAVGVKTTYIEAITEAQKPRSYLPNQFSLDAFMGLHDPQSYLGRHSADVGERPHIH